MSKKQKEAYVVYELEKAMLFLLSSVTFEDISISQITAQAQVSRSSFYRNYNNKEEIITGYIRRKLLIWQDYYHHYPDKGSVNPSVAMWHSLFNYLRVDRDLYLMLEERNLFYLFGQSIESIIMIDTDEPDEIVFTRSFVALGLYGWVRTWVMRGMNDEHSHVIVSYLNKLS